MDKLAIIGTGYMAMNIAETARRKGVYTLCFSNNQNDVAVKHADEFFCVSVFDKDEIVNICRANAVNGVIATTEITVYIAAYVANALGLNGNSPEIMSYITNKAAVRKITRDLKEIGTPEYIECSAGEQINANKFPVIVKPSQLGGKRGISVAHDEKQLTAALSYAQNAINGKNQTIVIEEYLAGGTEYSVESLSYSGEHYVIQITQKISSGPPHCVELGHMQPAFLSPEMREKAERAVKAVLRALNIQNGATHTEIKIIGDKIYLIEMNCRPGGDHIAYPLTDLSTGISYLGGAIDIALNKFTPHNVGALKKNHAGVLFVTKQTEYLLPLFEECEKYPWLYKVNRVTAELADINHNDGFNTNYIMYYSENGFPAELKNYTNFGEEHKHE